jgi:hypothetical protein
MAAMVSLIVAYGSGTHLNLRSNMSKGLIAFIGSLLLVVIVLGAMLVSAVRGVARADEAVKTASTALDRAVAARKLDARVLATRQVENAAQRLQLAHAQQALSQALQANSVWSDTNVPTAVQEAILSDSGGSNGKAD